MAYNEVAVSDLLRIVSQVLMNVTHHVGGLLGDRLGEPSGRVISATVTVYMALMALVLGFLAVGVLTLATFSYMFVAFAREFTWAAASPFPPSHPPSSSHGVMPLVRQEGSSADSDSGTAPSSSAPSRRPGRRTCQAHCVWLAGKQVNATQSAPMRRKTCKTRHPYVR